MGVENGMIVGAAKEDVQQQEFSGLICEMCQGKVNKHEITMFIATGDWICKDCERDYLREQGADFIEEFCTQNSADYLRNWWWEGLDVESKLDILKKAYIDFKRVDKALGGGQLAADRAAYCQDNDYFLDFVKERLL